MFSVLFRAQSCGYGGSGGVVAGLSARISQDKFERSSVEGFGIAFILEIQRQVERAAARRSVRIGSVLQDEAIAETLVDV